MKSAKVISYIAVYPHYYSFINDDAVERKNTNLLNSVCQHRKHCPSIQLFLKTLYAPSTKPKRNEIRNFRPLILYNGYTVLLTLRKSGKVTIFS